MVVLADHQKRGQSWNGRFRPYGNNTAQKAVTTAAITIVSRHLMSSAAAAQHTIHKKLAMTRPGGRMVKAKTRIAPMMKTTPRIL